MSTNDEAAARLGLKPVQFANPYHDEAGLFAPKGTGSRGGWKSIRTALGGTEEQRVQATDDVTAVVAESPRGGWIATTEHGPFKESGGVTSVHDTLEEAQAAAMEHAQEVQTTKYGRRPEAPLDNPNAVLPKGWAKAPPKPIDEPGWEENTEAWEKNPNAPRSGGRQAALDAADEVGAQTPDEIRQLADAYEEQARGASAAGESADQVAARHEKVAGLRSLADEVATEQAVSAQAEPQEPAAGWESQGSQPRSEWMPISPSAQARIDEALARGDDVEAARLLRQATGR